MIKKIIKRVKERYSIKIAKSAILQKRTLILLSKGAEIQDFVIIRTFDKKVIIGEFTQINPFTVIYGGDGVIIGNNCMIGPHCMLAAGNHDYIQTNKPMRFAGGLSKGPIVIEDDVWIGANSTITDGVKISKGSVVGANSVVTKNVKAYDIVAGTPAKKIGSRLKENGV